MTKKLAIMQPYFLAYIGYWQLIHAVDEFVVYDNIQFTKKGWFNRNNYLVNGEPRLFSLALKHDSDYLDVKDRFLSPEFEREKLINQLKGAYSKAPQFSTVMPILEEIIRFDDDNLFQYIHNSIKRICDYLGINTNIIISSGVPIDHSLKAENKVLAICKAQDAETYINAIGGKELYDKDKFKSEGIDLQFIRSGSIEYKQFGDGFVPSLSIIDIMMFNTKLEIADMLNAYTLE